MKEEIQSGRSRWMYLYQKVFIYSTIVGNPVDQDGYAFILIHIKDLAVVD